VKLYWCNDDKDYKYIVGGLFANGVIRTNYVETKAKIGYEMRYLRQLSKYHGTLLATMTCEASYENERALTECLSKFEDMIKKEV